VLLGQLAGLTGQDLPAMLPEATRDFFLLHCSHRHAAAMTRATLAERVISTPQVYVTW